MNPPPEVRARTVVYECIDDEGGVGRCFRGYCTGAWKGPRTRHCSVSLRNRLDMFLQTMGLTPTAQIPGLRPLPSRLRPPLSLVCHLRYNGAPPVLPRLPPLCPALRPDLPLPSLPSACRSCPSHLDVFPCAEIPRPGALVGLVAGVGDWDRADRKSVAGMGVGLLPLSRRGQDSRGWPNHDRCSDGSRAFADWLRESIQSSQHVADKATGSNQHSSLFLSIYLFFRRSLPPPCTPSLKPKPQSSPASAPLTLALTPAYAPRRAPDRTQSRSGEGFGCLPRGPTGAASLFGHASTRGRTILGGGGTSHLYGRRGTGEPAGE